MHREISHLHISLKSMQIKTSDAEKSFSLSPDNDVSLKFLFVCRNSITMAALSYDGSLAPIVLRYRYLPW